MLNICLYHCDVITIAEMKVYSVWGIQSSLRSSVVYKYKYNRCNSVYVGKTSRHLSTRIAEDMGISLSNPPFSQISKQFIDIHIRQG